MGNQVIQRDWTPLQLQQQTLKVLILGSISTFCLLGVGVSANGIKHADKKIKQLQDLKEQTASECKKDLDSTLFQQIQTRAQSSKNHQLTEDEIIVDNILLKGIVKCRQPIPSKFQTDHSGQYNNQGDNNQDDDDDGSVITTTKFSQVKHLHQSQESQQSAETSGVTRTDQQSDHQVSHTGLVDDDRMVQLIYRVNFSNIKYSNDSFDQIFKSKGHSRKYPDRFQELLVAPVFELVDGISNDSAQISVQTQPKICQSAFDHYGERYTDKQLSSSEKILSFISKVALFVNRCFALTHRVVISRGIEVGFNECELGIKVGGSLSILGDVIYNFRDRTLKMINPRVFIGEKMRYLQRIFFRRQEKIQQLCLLTIFGCISGYFLYREWRILKIARSISKNKQIDPLQSVKMALVGQVNEMKCDDCNNNTKQVLFKPCAHVVFCKECSTKLKPTHCPICNTQIEESVDIYFS